MNISDIIPRLPPIKEAREPGIMRSIVTCRIHRHRRPAKAVQECGQVIAIHVTIRCGRMTIKALTIVRIRKGRVGFARTREAGLPETEVGPVDVTIGVGIRKRIDTAQFGGTTGVRPSVTEWGHAVLREHVICADAGTWVTAGTRHCFRLTAVYHEFVEVTDTGIGYVCAWGSARRIVTTVPIRVVKQITVRTDAEAD